MRIIYVKKDAFPEYLRDGEDNGSGIILTRSFYTAKDIVSDGLPTIVLADNVSYSGAHPIAYATILKRETVANIIFLIVSRGEPVAFGQDIDGVLTMRSGLLIFGQLVRLARAFVDALVYKP